MVRRELPQLDFRETAAVNVDDRVAAHARDWRVTIHEIRTTETSQLGFGTRDGRAVVLKVIRKENGEEWNCGSVLAAFRGQGMIRPIEYTAGAVLLPRLQPGRELASRAVERRLKIYETGLKIDADRALRWRRASALP